MPAIEISALPQPNHVNIPLTVRNVALAVAKALGVPAHVVLCTWQVIPENFYASGDATANTQPEASHPPIVKLTLFEGRTPALIEGAINAIAEELQKAMKAPTKNAFITYAEAKSGQIFVGGAIKR